MSGRGKGGKGLGKGGAKRHRKILRDNIQVRNNNNNNFEKLLLFVSNFYLFLSLKNKNNFIGYYQTCYQTSRT
jgi:hypothetical protein